MAGIIPAAGSGSSGGKFRRRSYTPIADINVTPLVDVMLVLLIIFMITAPLLQVGVPVDLPKTSAQQVNRNLLISKEARADTKPQLEIYADDVKCSHGATVGKLDELSAFYMKSRGVNADTTRRLLTYAFAAEVLETIELEPLKEDLEKLTLQRYL